MGPGETICNGDVIRIPEKELLITETDVCIALTKPKNAADRKTFTDLRNLEDHQLHEISIKVNDQPAQREIGVKRFCSIHADKLHNGLLVVRQSLISDPMDEPQTITDLTMGVPPTEDNKNSYQETHQQRELLKLPSSVENNMIVIQSCPGTGKTTIST